MNRSNFYIKSLKKKISEMNKSSENQATSSTASTRTEHEPTKIFVHGLHPFTTSEDLHNTFSKHCQITDLVFKKNPKTGKHNGYAFFSVPSKEIAQKLIKEDHTLHNRMIHCDLKHNNIEDQKRNQRRRLFIGGLPRNISDIELTNIFKKFGNVRAAYSIKDLDGRSKNFGYVDFCDEKTAEKVLEIGSIRIKNKMVEVKPYVKKQRKKFTRDRKNKSEGKKQNVDFGRLGISGFEFNQFPDIYFQNQSNPMLYHQNPQNCYNWQPIFPNPGNLSTNQNRSLLAGFYDSRNVARINDFSGDEINQKSQQTQNFCSEFSNLGLFEQGSGRARVDYPIRKSSLEVKIENREKEEEIDVKLRSSSHMGFPVNEKKKRCFKLMKCFSELEGLRNFPSFEKLMKESGEEEIDYSPVEKDIVSLVGEDETFINKLIKNNHNSGLGSTEQFHLFGNFSHVGELEGFFRVLKEGDIEQE